MVKIPAKYYFGKNLLQDFFEKFLVFRRAGKTGSSNIPQCERPAPDITCLEQDQLKIFSSKGHQLDGSFLTLLATYMHQKKNAAVERDERL